MHHKSLRVCYFLDILLTMPHERCYLDFVVNEHFQKISPPHLNRIG